MRDIYQFVEMSLTGRVFFERDQCVKKGQQPWRLFFQWRRQPRLGPKSLAAWLRTRQQRWRRLVGGRPGRWRLSG